ncbi:MAG: tRNA (cytidine(34)-2'-O)-methyltransferase [Rhodospirillales bacterium]|nr:tRNA (cytidine(34)-2'-O)-methyltransferase [Rhodospirillales bacterium]MBO6785608.1 tRNA (cytidine(34)-2'-O)-methyltransferase [Rhodospirillales bacterium]
MTDPTVSLALYQPDIPQNAGNLFRTAACFGVPVHVIEPCGFVLSDTKMRRAGMDYMTHVQLFRHQSWEAYRRDRGPSRLVLLTTRGDSLLPAFEFEKGDTLLLGRESAGVPDDVHNACDARVALPMQAGLRSMNVAVCGGIVLYEALRQLHGFG